VVNGHQLPPITPPHSKGHERKLARSGTLKLGCVILVSNEHIWQARTAALQHTAHDTARVDLLAGI
jgi:hypothetical protein